jgi:DNA/RNA endonuclease YhcR with UshA esterase domain
MNLENKSYRGKLIEVIIKSFFVDNLLESADKLKEVLQGKLDSNLKFETSVSEVENKNGLTYGQISFKDEDGNIKVSDFTVCNTGSIV